MYTAKIHRKKTFWQEDGPYGQRGLVLSTPKHNGKSGTFSCLSKARTWGSNVVCRGLFCVQWVMMRGICSLCCYWWYW